MSNITETLLYICYSLFSVILFVNIAKGKGWQHPVVVGVGIPIVAMVISGMVKQATESPLIGFGIAIGWFVLCLLIVIAVPRNPNAPQTSELVQAGEKKCPFCAELMKAEAVKCRFCGSGLADIQVRIPTQSEQIGITCKKCGEAFTVHASNKGHTVQCPACESPFWVSRKAHG